MNKVEAMLIIGAILETLTSKEMENLNKHLGGDFLFKLSVEAELLKPLAGAIPDEYMFEMVRKLADTYVFQEG